MLGQSRTFFSPHFRLDKVSYLFWMLRQGYCHKLNFVIVPQSVDVLRLLTLCHKRGLLSGFQLTRGAVKIFLKWSVEGESAFQTVKTYSQPSREYNLHYTTFVQYHLRSCSVAPIWIFKTKLGYTDQFTLYKYKIGGSLLAIIN